MTADTEPPVRIARRNGVCASRACTTLIVAGAPIVKPGPGRGWRHVDCEAARRPRGRKNGAR